MSEQQHWAFFLIGKPYAYGGEGPDEFNCWGLVRWVFRNVFSIEMPLIRVGLVGEAQEEEIRSVTRLSGWRPTPDARPCDRAIVLMWRPSGRQSGLALVVNGGLFVLHAIEDVGVVLTPYAELWLFSFSRLTHWRKA